MTTPEPRRHSLLPWKISDFQHANPDDGISILTYDIKSQDNKYVASFVTKEDYQLIFNAVNHHSKLIEALTHSTYMLQSIGGTHRDIAQAQILVNQALIKAARGECL